MTEESEVVSGTPAAGLRSRFLKPEWARPVYTLAAVVVGSVLFVYFFEPLSTVILGVLAAAIVANALHPLAEYLPARRGLAAAVVGLGFIVVVAGLMLAFSLPLAGPIQRQFSDLPSNREHINELLKHWSNALGATDPLTVENLMQVVGQFFAGPGLVSRGANAVLGILIWLVFIFVGSVFMLADTERLVGPALHVVSPYWRGRVEDMIGHLGPRLRRWVLGTIMSMCIVFSASAIGYSIVGLKFALPLALLAGLAEIVPTVGPACAVAVALLLAATQSGAKVVGVLIVYAVIQAIEAYVILPMIMRGAVNIHPAVTLFSVVLWGKVFGVPGLMLAIPINLTIGAAIEYLYLRPRREKEVAAEVREAKREEEAVGAGAGG